MKSQTSLAITLALFLTIFFLKAERASASHSIGAEINYTHLIGNDYLIHVVFYRNCSGLSAPTNVIVDIVSVQCGSTNSVVLNPLPGGPEITSSCSGATTCQGGTEIGIQKWEYESTYSFPGQCPDWILSTSFTGRNPAITTILNPGVGDLYVEARLNNANGDNTTPQFSAQPNIYFCIGQQFVFNNGAIDPDGDSLAYSLVPARMDANTSVSYMNPYSGLQPLSSIPPIDLDPVTGDLVINPTTVEVSVLVFLIQEFRNGQLIGSIIREIPAYTVSCATNSAPQLTGPDGMNISPVYVLPDVPFCYNQYSSDPDSDIVTLMANVSSLPGASFTTFGSPFPTGQLCWAPDTSDVRPQPYLYTVALTDDGCPHNGASVYSYAIVVTTDSSLITPLLSLGNNQDAKANEKLTVLPNPFHQHAEIILGRSFANVESHFRVFSAMGEVVEIRTVNASSIFFTKGNLNAGIYFFELWNVFGRRATGKFIID